MTKRHDRITEASEHLTTLRSKNFNPRFARLGMVLKPNDFEDERLGVLNPGCARLRDNSLRLYPRMVAEGNVSSIGSFAAEERPDGTLDLRQCGYALKPAAPYELRDTSGGYGCEDPRVTFIPVLDRYVMAYVAFGPRGPEIAAAISQDGLTWERLGLIKLRGSGSRFSDKDPVFFPEPVMSPKGVKSLAFYHRPSAPWPSASTNNLRERRLHEGISIGYIPLEPVLKNVTKLCEVSETHRLELPKANWGKIKVGGGTPPVRIEQGWLSVIHGVDLMEFESGACSLRYCAGLLVHDATRPARVLYRSPDPLFVPEVAGEIQGTVGRVVFPTGIDPRPDIAQGTYDIYYGMADFEIGRGRLTLGQKRS
jgi:beta-1,2-mannobiose phosphorylase / 1,2-beta-oligomannan phosphorylase